MEAVIVVLLVGLIGLAVIGITIGRMSDRRSQEAAWRRIATARRINAERARELDDQQIALHRIEDALAARARRLESRDPPASGFPMDWPTVRPDDSPVGYPDSAA